ncbi:hypothetical protein F4819DRAFT_446130 [Hypoxylon fuscum]|nr:hypothetical protein F4819DRAFT_446130 [Hypoxylon fuscum]
MALYDSCKYPALCASHTCITHKYPISAASSSHRILQPRISRWLIPSPLNILLNPMLSCVYCDSLEEAFEPWLSDFSFASGVLQVKVSQALCVLQVACVLRVMKVSWVLVVSVVLLVLLVLPAPKALPAHKVLLVPQSPVPQVPPVPQLPVPKVLPAPQFLVHQAPKARPVPKAPLAPQVLPVPQVAHVAQIAHVPQILLNPFNLIFRLLDHPGISIFFHDLIDLITPRVLLGLWRVYWRCSYNALLWGDFPNDPPILEGLKNEISEESSTLDEKNYGAYGDELPTSNLEMSANTRISLKHANGDSPIQASDKIINIMPRLKYFEVCVNIGYHAIEHHEFDISIINSDWTLFEEIRGKYKASRGSDMRRLFLRPRYVHFAMFSISGNDIHGTRIHQKPNI